MFLQLGVSAHAEEANKAFFGDMQVSWVWGLFALVKLCVSLTLYTLERKDSAEGVYAKHQLVHSVIV